MALDVDLGFRQLRDLAGLTQAETARRSNITRLRLSLAETGQLLFRPEERERLIKVLSAAIQERQVLLAEARLSQPQLAAERA